MVICLPHIVYTPCPLPLNPPTQTSSNQKPPTQASPLKSPSINPSSPHRKHSLKFCSNPSPNSSPKFCLKFYPSPSPSLSLKFFLKFCLNPSPNHSMKFCPNPSQIHSPSETECRYLELYKKLNFGINHMYDFGYLCKTKLENGISRLISKQHKLSWCLFQSIWFFRSTYFVTL